MKSKRMTAVAVAVFGIVFVSVDAAYGQACIGVPIAQGSYGAQAGFGFTDGASTIGLSVTNNAAGPLSVTGSYGMTTIDQVDPRMHSLSGTIAYETPDLAASICPATGLSYDRLSRSEDGISVTASSLTIPVGLGIGYATHPEPDMVFAPFITPALMLMRNTASISGTDTPLDGSETETETEFGLIIGGALGIQSFFGNLSVRLDSIEGSDPVYSVGFGLQF